MKCPSCADENAQGEEFCVRCGTELAVAKQEPPAEALTGEEPQTAESPPPKAATTQVPPPLPVHDPAAEEELRFHSAAPYPITISVAGATHEGLYGISRKGLKGKNNEDAYHADSIDYPKHSIALRMLVVADGMGSGEAGEIISRQAVYDTVTGLWFLAPTHDQHLDFGRLDFWRFANRQYEQYLTNQVASANSRVHRYIKAKRLRSDERQTPGSTIVVAAVLCDLELGRVAIHGFSNGDARAYLVLNGECRQLSTDQTVMNCPSSYLGQFEHLTGKPFAYHAWLADEHIETGWLILCSDGFWNMLSPEDTAKICGDCETAEQATARLIEAALQVETPYGRRFDERVKTGDDNLTLTVLEFTAKEAARNELPDHA